MKQKNENKFTKGKKILAGYWRKQKNLMKRMHKYKEPKGILTNTHGLINARKNVIPLFDDYTTIEFEDKYKAIKGEGLKVSALKQIF